MINSAGSNFSFSPPSPADAPRNASNFTSLARNIIPPQVVIRISLAAILFDPSLPSPAFFPRRLSLERPRRRLQAPLINFDSSDPLSLPLSSRLSSMDDIFDRIFGRRVREEAWKRVNLKAFCRPRFRNVARFPTPLRNYYQRSFIAGVPSCHSSNRCIYIFLLLKCAVARFCKKFYNNGALRIICMFVCIKINAN